MKFINVYSLSSDRVKCMEPGVSITQPDEALSIQEILVRVSKGLTTGVGASVSEADYDDPNDDDFDDPTLQPGFDKLDALSISTNDKSAELREMVEDGKRKKRKKDHDDMIEAEVQKRLKEKEQQDN